MTEKIVTIGLQIVPKSTTIPTYSLVDAAIDVIQKSGIKHLITPFETVMEGDYTEIMNLCDAAQRAVLKAGAEECLVYFRMHYSTEKDITFEEKKLDR